MLVAVMTACKLVFTATTADMGVDGGFYLDVARHVRDGDGLVSSISLYHMGFPEFPHPSAIYPLWPLLLGYLGRLMPLTLLAAWLPSALYFVTLALAYRWGTEQTWERTFPAWLDGLHGGHLLVLLLGLNGSFFRYTSMPYADGLSFALLFAALLRAHRRFTWPSLVGGLELGAWLALLVLARSQLVLVALAAACALLWGLALSQARAAYLRMALGTTVALIAVLMPQLLHIASFADGHVLASLVRFDLAGPQSPLTPMSLIVPTTGVFDLLRDRLGGVWVAFAPSGRFKYAEIFYSAIYILPLALGVGVLELTQRRREILGVLWRSAGDRDAPQRVLNWALALGAFASLHLAHKAYFTEWHFARRHAIPVVLLLLLTAVALLASHRRWVRIATAVLLVIGIVQGAAAAVDRSVRSVRAAVADHPELAGRRALVTWVQNAAIQHASRASSPLVVAVDSQEAQQIGWQLNGVGVHWVGEITGAEDLTQLARHFRIQYLVLKKESVRRPDDTPPPFLTERQSLERLFVPLDTGLADYDVYERRRATLDTP